MIARWLAVLAVVFASAAPALAQAPVEAARGLLQNYQQDPARIDRARDLLVAAVQQDPQPEALILLARTWFLLGEIRAASAEQRRSDYERGRDAGRRAVEMAPQNPDAHLWYAINLGRWAETKGKLHAAAELSTVKDETAIVLRLQPDSIEGNTLAGSLARELPGFLGGSAARSEEHFQRALALDPHRSGVRVQLARLYIATKRYADARRELQLALDEPTPSDLAYWTVKGQPEARALLDSIHDKS